MVWLTCWSVFFWLFDIFWLLSFYKLWCAAVAMIISLSLLVSIVTVIIFALIVSLDQFALSVASLLLYWQYQDTDSREATSWQTTIIVEHGLHIDNISLFTVVLNQYQVHHQKCQVSVIKIIWESVWIFPEWTQTLTVLIASGHIPHHAC